MGQLFFKKPLQLAIREGRKRTTIRRWPADRPGVCAGQRVFSPGLGWLTIGAVEPVTLESLDEDDARADGFENAAEMVQMLLALYPEHAGDGKQWYRVRFTPAQLRPVRIAKARRDSVTEPPLFG